MMSLRKTHMIGVHNRLPHVVCEVGSCFFPATHTESITVRPGDPALKDELHEIDIVLCQLHDRAYQTHGLIGTVTAYGDEVVAQDGVMEGANREY